jgi:hypothetical protein
MDWASYAIGVYVASSCGEAGPERDYEATILVSRLVALLSTEGRPLGRDSIRRRLRTLQQQGWLVADSGQGRRIWRVRCLELAPQREEVEA